MKRLQVVAAIYNGFIWACLLTLLCVRSVIICMNINMGVLFLASFIVFSVILALVCLAGKKKIGAKFSLINLCICSLVLFLIYQFVYHQDLLLKPVFIVRMVFHNQIVSVELINGILMAVIILGYFCVLATQWYMQTRKNRTSKIR